MSKTRVYELAKAYRMKGNEMAKLLRELGFENIKSHMAALDAADEMMVVARLEAQGLRRDGGGKPGAASDGVPKKKSLTAGNEMEAAAGDAAVVAQAPGAPVKKALPGAANKKSLPPPVGRSTPTKKALPGDGADEAEPATPAVEPKAPAAALPTVETPAPAAPAAPAAKPVPEPQTPAAKAPPEPTTPAKVETPAAPTAPTPPPEPAAKPEPVAPKAPPVIETPAEPAAEPETRTPAPEPEAPAAAAPQAEVPSPGEPETPAAATPSPAAETPETPATEPAEPAAADGTTMEPDGVKRLLIPQSKARVIGKIDLPQETIRDATRRSAPNAGDANRNLRRMALQNTQRRGPGGRGALGQRRGPGAGRGRDNRTGRKPARGGAAPAPTVDPNKVVEIEPPISLKALSEALGIKVNDLIATLTFKLGVPGKTINSFVTPDEVELIALELERKINIVERKVAEDEMIASLTETAEKEDKMLRAPVVTFMGHVDHGKTTLLDALRTSDVARGESGGITQHMGAYRVDRDDGHSFVVLDTPGHAAFTSMRARGAKITDVIVLVVASDDGVMPQTEEAISHAKEAGVPIVVAVNKSDVAGANPMQVRQQLSVKGLQPEEWGGDTQIIDVSAKTGEGLDALVEAIALQSEIMELEARPEAQGRGVIVESKQTPEQGVVVTVLITDGTLRVRDQVICGESLARVRGMVNDRGESVEEAGPSTPVTLLGIDTLPTPGDQLFAVEDARKAKEVIEDRRRRARDMSLAERSAVTMDTLSAKLAEREISEVKLIIKADVMGSLEPIKTVLSEMDTEEVRFRFVHTGLGGINDTDVSLAEASGAILIGFNTIADQTARIAADRAGVEIKYYDVIYELVTEMRDALEGMLKPDEIENIIGHAEVRATFKSSRWGVIAGCYVTDGVARRDAKVRLSRGGTVVYTGKVASLKRVNDDAKEVRTGFECGMKLENFNDVKEGDQLEFAEVELVARTLD